MTRPGDMTKPGHPDQELVVPHTWAHMAFHMGPPEGRAVSGTWALQIEPLTKLACTISQ